MLNVNMKQILVAWFGAIVLPTVASSLALAQNTSEPTIPASSNAAKDIRTASTTKTSTWKFESEQEWIVDSIGRDIAEMLVYAKYHSDATTKFSAASIDFHTITIDKNAGKYKFRLVLPDSKAPIEREFILTDYAWSPGNYQSFAQQLLDAMHLKPESMSTAPNNYLKTLAAAEMSGLFTENQRISKALSANPLDPSLHEQAALLQATFDMLELANIFSDTRPPLNRMSAHLALAQALYGDTKLTIVGQLADIALESMSCRDGVAVTKNDLVAKTQSDPTVQSWLRALKIRSSGDYRLFDEKNQTQIEASQFGMRYANYLSADKALEYVAKHQCTPPVRWMRIVKCGSSSVASGHAVTAQMIQAELADFVSDYKLYNKKTLANQEDLVSELNKTPTRCLIETDGSTELVALSWPDVAAFHARHLLCAVEAAYNFYAYMYCVPEEADSTINTATRLFSALTLFPFALHGVEFNEKHKELNDRYLRDTEQVFLNHPELVTAWNWGRSKFVAKSANPPAVLTKPELWFAPPYPMGTAFYFDNRKSVLDTCKPDFAELSRLRNICPLDESVCMEWTKKKYGEHPTSAQLKEGYGALVDFNIFVMRETAAGDYKIPAEYEAQMEKIAKVDPADYITLASYCAQHNEPAKAQKYFQAAIDKCDNSVKVANTSEWLVKYLYSHGDKDKALQIAKNSAEVYSQGGLCTLAKLYELMGNLVEAEKYFLMAKERYDDSVELGGFYTRNASKDKRYAAESDRMLKETFPAGLKHYDFAQLKVPPTAGVLITSVEEYPAEIGLRKNFILVGLNGYFTDNQKQFFGVRSLPIDPKFRVAYWDGNNYKEVVLQTVNGNRLGIDMADYKPTKATQK